MRTQVEEVVTDSIEQPGRPATVHYYRKQALEHGAAGTSRMFDEIIRDKEVDATLRFLDSAEGSKLLKVGCGNGLPINKLAKRFGSRFQLHGIDLTPEMLEVAPDAIRPAECKLRNTEFGKFFAAALPPRGDYSPIRIKYLRKLENGGGDRQEITK